MAKIILEIGAPNYPLYDTHSKCSFHSQISLNVKCEPICVNPSILEGFVEAMPLPCEKG